MRRIVVGLLVCVLMLLGAPALAAIIDVKYCVDYDLDYTDGATGDYLTGTETPAIGAKLQLERTNGTIEWIYLDWEGTDAGCGWFNDISVGTNETFTVRLVRMAYVNGNYLKVFTTSGIGGYLYSSQLATGHHPVHNTGYAYDTGPSDSIHILAAASFAMSREPGTASGDTINFYTEPCPFVGSPCYNQPSPNLDVYIPTGFAQYKFVVSHELGHAISDEANGRQGLNQDYTGHQSRWPDRV
jgi:hypothetical protein